VDLVRGEALARVVAQVGQDLLAQPAGPGGRGLLPSGGGLDRPAGLGGLLVDLVQAGPRGAQVPAAVGQRGGSGAGGGLDLRDMPGDLRDQGRVGRGGGSAAVGGAAVDGQGGLVLLVGGGCVLLGRAAVGGAALGRVAVGRASLGRRPHPHKGVHDPATLRSIR